MQIIMKKKLLIILGSISAVLGVAIAVAIIYAMPYIKTINPSLITWSNIKSLYMGVTSSQEQLDQKLKDGDDVFAEKIKNHVDIAIRDFTQEELAQVESGEKTKTEIVAEIITTEHGNTSTTPDDNSNTPDNKENNNTTPVTKTETSDEIVARHIANLYAYHNEFEGRLAALESTVRNYLHAYKRANPNITWHDAKVATLQKFINDATAIETDCYARVDGEIELLRADLKAIGADLSVVDVVRDAAYNEMDLRKAKIVNEGTAKLNK